eukprot:3914637-Prorocentrum_lima.AAC.1
MTSSLVGSEMCIRDRPSGGDTLRFVSYNATSLCCSHPLTSVRVQLPVSYTHLTLPTICSV